MSYPPEASRSCHEADGRSDRSGGSGGAAGSTGSGGVYGPLCGTSGKWPFSTISNDPQVATDRLLSNWKKWSLGLDYLLQDSEGVALFKSYLQYEGCSNLLDFWFACQGFRSKVDPSDHRKISQLIKAIYRTYIRGSSSGNVGFTTAPITTMLTEPQVLIQPRTEPIRLRTETRRLIAERISRKHALDQTVFDPAQAEVEQFLRTTAYPAFLKSDVYVDFLQSTLEGSNRRFQFSQPGTSWSSCLVDSASGHSVHGLPEGPTNFPLSGKILPTLEEDRELNSEELSGHVGLSHLRPASSSCPPNPAGDSVHLLSSAQSPPWHCPHCSQYHSQGHQTPCTANDPVQRTNYPPPHLFPPGFRPPFSVPTTTNVVVCSAPLTVENLQMTRFYRAELSLQQHTFSNHPTHSQQQHPTPPASMPASFGPFRPPLSPPPALIQPQDSGDANRPRNAYYYYRGCDQKPEAYPRAHLNYMYTHWADAVCPPPTQASDPRSGNRLPSQPPNPYHISYAPVSARDSERHSLSSEARTDDTHSHTDSSHDGGGTRLWHSFGHRHAASHSYHQSDRHTQQHQPPPQQQHHNQSTAAAAAAPQPSAPAAPSLRCQAADYPHLAECSECVCTHHRATVTSLSSPIPFVTSPRSAFPTRDDSGHSQRLTGLDAATGTSMTQSQVGQRMQPVQTTDHQPGRSHAKHQRRAVRRGVTGWRSGDRSKSAAVPAVGDALPEPVASKTTVSRSHNLAERDPQAFFRLLSEKLQHVLDNQLATERLDRIMTDTSPVPPHSTGDQTTDFLPTAGKQPDPTDDTTTASTAGMTVSTAAAPEVAVPTTVPDARQSGLAVSSLLQRPWADRLLAAARIHENTRDNAQAILEDHCSRIWAASADRTPTSSGSGSGGAGGEVGVLGSAGTNTLMTETDNAVRLYELGCRSLEPAFHLKTHQPVTHAKENEAEDDSRSLHSPRSGSSSQCSEVAGNPLQATRSRHHALLPSGKEEGEMWPSDSMAAPSGVQPAAPLEQQSGKECTVDNQPAPDSPSSMSSYVESSASPGMLPTTLPCGRLSNMGSSVRSVGLQVVASSVLPCITTPRSVSSSSTTTSVVSVSTPGLPVSSPSSGSPHSLVIGYYLGDDPVPYRSLWPSAEITLGQFKQLIPKKKGSFRYFFKKLSNEFGSGVVHQEITNDSCLLPLWEGKVVAKVERIE
ncbi:hypothetical protein CRM22_003192 [Opisthorchis felineus]|uniref:RGS domain-containing protein n=1 Tax=Opisthorchis felineus TaxID=147828 RepID=A0A4S2M307_OPIFE|nr:hypothetical protein CRM22_003192 [Opisthorchis felineus]